MLAMTAVSGVNESNLATKSADWGVSISEIARQKTMSQWAMDLGGKLGLTIASFLAIPILVGAFFFTMSTGAYLEIGIVAVIVGVGAFLNSKAKSGPKNALQIDYNSSEVRLGSINSVGAFVRHKVCPFRAIDEVTIDFENKTPAICLQINGEIAKIHLASKDDAELSDLGAKISAAAEAAKAAPIRSRIQSKINGFEANVREVGQRVRSRVRSRIS